MKFETKENFISFCNAFYLYRMENERAAYIAKRRENRRAIDYSRSKADKVVYMDTIITDKNRVIGDVAKGGKLAGLAILRESVNCGRCIFLRAMIDAGYLPENTNLVSCFQSETCKGCWQNFTQNHCGLMAKDKKESFADLENCDPTLKTIEKFFKGLFNTDKGRAFVYADVPFIRAGQAGDSSHSFVTVEETSNAAAFLDGFEKKNIDKPVVFISASYAPVSIDDYRKLSPYQDRSVLHFSLSPWFSDEENALRIAGIKTALDAGLENVFVRMVTNADSLDGWNNDRLAYIMQLLEFVGVGPERVLETPYHNDGAPGRPHSHATGLFKYRCCSSGSCLTCPVKCMTRFKELEKSGVVYPENEFHVKG